MQVKLYILNLTNFVGKGNNLYNIKWAHFENILYGQRVCKQVARAQRLIMNKHCLDLYLFEDKLGKAVIYAAGAQKYSEQVNKHRDENVGLTEVNK